MKYLGKISGSGTIKGPGVENACATYEFEGFSRKTGHMSGSGEITLAPLALRSLFGRSGVQLHTDSGRVFTLKFSDKELSASNCANVEIIGGLPVERNWRH